MIFDPLSLQQYTSYPEAAKDDPLVAYPEIYGILRYTTNCNCFRRYTSPCAECGSHCNWNHASRKAGSLAAIDPAQMDSRAGAAAGETSANELACASSI